MEANYSADCSPGARDEGVDSGGRAGCNVAVQERCLSVGLVLFGSNSSKMSLFQSDMC